MGRLLTSCLYIDKANLSLCTEIADLLRISFKERLDSGLNFTCALFSPDDVKDHIEGKYLFTVRDSDSLVAMMTLSKTKESGHMEYVAVHPDYKCNGLASRLYKYMENYSKSLDIKYLTSTTACKADSSVYWHKKMGFLIYGLGSDTHTNYFSYLFKKPLCDKSKWDNPLYVKLIYILYYIAIHIGKKKNGELTCVGKLLLKVKGYKIYCNGTTI